MSDPNKEYKSEKNKDKIELAKKMAKRKNTSPSDMLQTIKIQERFDKNPISRKTDLIGDDSLSGDFQNTSSSKDYDDDGYEEGKSKERETFLSLGELLKMNPGAEGEASKEERDAARAQVRDEAKVKKGKKKKD